MNFSSKITYSQTLLFSFRVAPLQTMLQLMTHFIGIIIAPINVLATAHFINTALNLYHNDFIDFYHIYRPLVLIMALQVYIHIIEPFVRDVTTKQRAIKSTLALEVPVILKQARLEYKHLEHSNTADLLNRIVKKGGILRLCGSINNLVRFIVLVANGLSYSVILIYNAPLSGGLLIALSFPAFWIAIKAGRASYAAHQDTSKLVRMYENMKKILIGRDTVAERTLFGYSSQISNRYLEYYEAVRKHTLKVSAKWFLRSKGAAAIIVVLCSAALFMLMPSVVRGDMSLGLYISLLGTLFGLTRRISIGLPDMLTQFVQDLEFIKEFNQFLALSETADAEILPSTNPPPFENLEFRNVSFIYPNTNKKILEDVSFIIENGHHYAFVGANGAGKTTIIKLITCLYREYTGEILLNGKNIKDWPMADIKAMFCVAFQDFARYDITLGQNVSLGKINGADDGEIQRAISISGIDEKAKELKMGKDTLLGKTHEDSIELSGGQWQRVALAREIISTAAVKILDEPTAALDPMAESRMYTQFEEISRGFTTIFISHRLASAKLASTIFVLNNGRIIEQGSHDVLMSQKSLYFEMFQSQKSWYVNEELT